AADLRVDEHRDLVGVPVVDVVRRELEVPAGLAGVDVDGDERRRVEVVPLARVAVPVRARVAGAPVDQPQRRIVGAGQPRRAAAVHPAVAGPAFAARFAGRWYRPEAPRQFSGLRVVGVEEAADAGLAAADADDHLVVDDQRRGGDRVAGRVLADVDGPAFD